MYLNYCFNFLCIYKTVFLKNVYSILLQMIASVIIMIVIIIITTYCFRNI